MAKWRVTLTRTRLQEVDILVNADTEDAAETVVNSLLAKGEDFEKLEWSEGENEGAIDVDVRTPAVREADWEEA